MKGNQTDEGVMRRLAGGDDAALSELMRRWQAAIWCFVDRMIGSPALTDDICQEVWTHLFLYRRSYDPDRPFRSWLFATALNCCRSAMRKRQSQSRQVVVSNGDGPLENLSADDPPPVDGMVLAEEVAALHRAIAYLPDMQRSVVLLYLLYNSNYRAIADLLDRSVSTVRSQMHHALRRLRGRLTKLTLASERQLDHERMEQ